MSCQQNTFINCPCTYSCSKHAKCCECLSYHLQFKEFPACFFSKEMEARYDRSFEALKKDREGEVLPRNH